jgi:VWFA-related protein
MARSPAVLAFVAWSVLAASGHTQTPGPSAPASPDAQPVFRSGVDLVLMDVRVLDDSGRPVKDLRADEVRIIEQGEPRPILFFQHVDEPDAPYVEVARRTIASEVSTNRGAPRGHLYVLVFDQQHITAGNEVRARQAAERFLRTRIRPGDRVALYAFPGPGPLVGFTSDVGRAIAELPRIRGSLERIGFGALGAMNVHEAYQIARGDSLKLSLVAARLSAQGAGTDVARASGFSGLAGGAGGSADPFFSRLVLEDARTIVARADEQARQFLLALTGLLRDLREIEGRKVIVLASEGFFTDNVSREIEAAAAAAARSSSTIHGLDLNRRTDTVRDAGPAGGDAQAEIAGRLESLGSLAAETDGTLFVDAASRIDAVFEDLAAESQEYYLVGFAPSAAALADRTAYRRVRIEVRRPGVRVKARTGYAMEPAAPTPADRRRAIDTALRAPYPQQGLPVEFTTYVLGGASPGAERVVMSLRADLPVAARDAGPQADVVFAVRDARDGRIVASGTDRMALPPEPSAGRATGAGTYKVQFELPPGEYLMRVVVREPGGLVGSADRRFTVRALGAADVSASDLVFGSTAGELAVRTVGAVGEILPGLVEVYGPTERALADVDVRVALAPIGGSPLLRVQGDPLPVAPTRQGYRRPVRLDLPLADLEPGTYVAEAIVTADGQVVAELTREVEVVRHPPARAAAAPRGPASEPAAMMIDPVEVLAGEVAQEALARAAAAADGGGALSPAVELARAGRWDRVAELMAASPADAAAPLAALLQGMVRFARREFAEAGRAWQACLDADPSASRVAFLLGWAHAASGDDRAAVGAWRNAVRLDPGLVAAHLAIADAFTRQQNVPLALQALRAGLAARPDSPELLDRLSRLERP